MKKDLQERIETLAKLLFKSRYPVFFTGAGISTESGLPDFRGPDGMWTRRDKGLAPKSGRPWDSVEPNSGHMALAELQRMGKLRFLISQNVDNLHLKSRVPSLPLPPRYVEVDVLRGLAAFWVVLSHYLPYWNRYLGPAPTIMPEEGGVYAVKLFFMISGFVIFMTLDRCKSVADFAVLRFSRLYPAYWATLVLATGVSVLVFGRSFWPAGFLVNATMLEDFLGYPRFDNIYWTLTVQIAFYTIAGFLFALGLHRRTLSFVVVWLVIAAIWVLMFQQTDIDHRHWLALLFALDFSPYFGMGIVFFDVAKHGWSAARAGIVGLAIATEFLIAGWVGLCVALIAAILFVLAIRGNLRFLVSKVTLWLGAISYALFLVHRNLGYESLDWLHEHHVSLAVAVPVTILGALAIATLVTYGVEKPALQHIRSWHHEWKTRRARSGV